MPIPTPRTTRAPYNPLYYIYCLPARGFSRPWQNLECQDIPHQLMVYLSKWFSFRTLGKWRSVPRAFWGSFKELMDPSDITVSLYQRLYSADVPEFVSENEEILRAVDTVRTGADTPPIVVLCFDGSRGCAGFWGSRREARNSRMGMSKALVAWCLGAELPFFVGISRAVALAGVSAAVLVDIVDNFLW